MSAGPHPPPISSDEFLYRRVPKSRPWHHPGEALLVDDQAFRPIKTDTTGLSLERAKSADNPDFKSIEEAAIGPSPAGYVVAVLPVQELARNGVLIEPRTQGAGPGHVELPQLTYASRKTPAAIELMRILSRSVIRVEDPVAG
jgi:hypothetical protein